MVVECPKRYKIFLEYKNITPSERSFSFAHIRSESAGRRDTGERPLKEARSAQGRRETDASKGRTVGPEGLQGTRTRPARTTENRTGVTLLGAPGGYALKQPIALICGAPRF